MECSESEAFWASFSRGEGWVWEGSWCVGWRGPGEVEVWVDIVGWGGGRRIDHGSEDAKGGMDIEVWGRIDI